MDFNRYSINLQELKIEKGVIKFNKNINFCIFTGFALNGALSIAGMLPFTNLNMVLSTVGIGLSVIDRIVLENDLANCDDQIENLENQLKR